MTKLDRGTILTFDVYVQIVPDQEADLIQQIIAILEAHDHTPDPIDVYHRETDYCHIEWEGDSYSYV